MTARTEQPATHESTPVDVSVVVGTFNRADALRRALASLTAQETDGAFQYEIVIVDNASTDHTQQAIAECERGQAIELRSVVETHRGVAQARNRGIREARGEWLAFFDDDQLADPRWLAELMASAERHAARVVGGDVRLELPADCSRDLAPECRRLLGEMVGMDDQCRFTRKIVPGTGNMMIHRSVLVDVGTFDAALEAGGEDADLYRRIRSAGYASWYTPRAVVFHIIPAHRLSKDYMRWTALRQGGHVAHRELLDWGRLRLAAVVLARILQANMLYLPRLVTAWVRGDRERALAARCLLWRAEGYVRQALAYLLPGMFGQRAFFESMNFRQGRQRLAGR